MDAILAAKPIYQNAPACSQRPGRGSQSPDRQQPDPPGFDGADAGCLGAPQSRSPCRRAEVRLLLEGIAARINTISQLHRLLRHVSSDGVTNLKPHLHDVTNALVAALSSEDQQVRVEHSGDDCMVLMRHVQPIILILCEVFINAMKYAHPAGVPLVMTVDCRAANDGRLVLTVSDDGVGLPEGFDLAANGGLGFKVMRSLAAEIGAEFQIETSNLGLSFRVSMPAGSMAGTRLSDLTAVSALPPGRRPASRGVRPGAHRTFCLTGLAPLAFPAVFQGTADVCGIQEIRHARQCHRPGGRCGDRRGLYRHRHLAGQ